MSNDYRDKFEGCIVGLAVGDALGMPCEAYSMNDLLKEFGRIENYLKPKKGHFNYGKLKAGMYTDDTEQALILAETIKDGEFDIKLFAKNLFEYGRKIFENPELDRWVGGTFKKAVKNYINGKPLTKCGVSSKSCGSAMRVAPLGLNFGWATEVRDRAATSSKITHLGKDVTAAAEAVALYVNLSLKRNDTPYGMSNKISGLVGLKGENIEKRIEKAYELREEKPGRVIRILGDDSLAREVVPTAIYSFHHSPENFEEAVLTAVNMGGDTDSRAAITGAISGTFNGIDSIPKRWIKNLENNKKLIEIGDKLANSMPL